MINLRTENDPHKINGVGKTLKDILITKEQEQIDYLKTSVLGTTGIINSDEEQKYIALVFIKNTLELMESNVLELSKCALILNSTIQLYSNKLDTELLESITILRNAIYDMLEKIPYKPTGKEEEDNESSIINESK